MPSFLMTADQQSLFLKLARTYSWDMIAEEARNWPGRLFRRVMDLGTLEDVVAMESSFGCDALVYAIETAEAGSMRPQSWAFWHYRLRIVPFGEACPPLPARRVA